MPVISYIDAVTMAIREEMERDSRVFVLGEDVGKKGGVFKATQGLYDQFLVKSVFIDTPLAESAIAGVGIGAAMYGMRPIAECSLLILSCLLLIKLFQKQRRYVIVRIMIGIAQWLFGHRMVVVFMVHCIILNLLKQCFANQPGLKIVMPSTPYDVKGLLKAAIRDEDPVIFFEHKRAYRLIKGEVPDDDYVLPIGKADVKREGDDITVITYGLSVHFALQAAERLAQDGIEAHILDLRTVYPLDKEAIIEAASKTGKVLLVTEDNKEGSIMSEVSAIIAENCLFDLDAPIMRLAGPDVPAMPYAPTMEKYFMVNPDKVEKSNEGIS